MAGADDGFLAALLARLLSDRQLEVAAPVQAWLLTQLPRTPDAVRAAVARLDQAALAAGQRISRTLAVDALGELICDKSGISPADASPPGAGLG